MHFRQIAEQVIALVLHTLLDAVEITLAPAAQPAVRSAQFGVTLLDTPGHVAAIERARSAAGQQQVHLPIAAHVTTDVGAHHDHGLAGQRR